MPKKPVFLIVSALFFFLPAYYIFSDDYGGNLATALIGSVANVLHMGPAGLVLIFCGITTTVLAYRYEEDAAEG